MWSGVIGEILLSMNKALKLRGIFYKGYQSRQTAKELSTTVES